VPDLHRLLDVQDRDIELDQLRHRRESLPDRLALAEQEASIARLEAELAGLQDRLGELQRAQKRLEDEVGTIEAKGETESRKLNSGTITVPRELQALSEEVDALARRQRTLEDEILDVMEATEPVVADVDRLQRERDAGGSEAERLRAAILEQERAIDEEAAAARSARDEAAAVIAPDLLSRYEKLKTRLGGIGVARLEGDRCLGCHLTLPATEVDAIRRAPADAVVTHEECGRILVRTPAAS
jgi:predicted  nucleic acid-binding Zn-ribbon protein